MLKSLCIALHLCTSLSGVPIIVDGDSLIIGLTHIRIMGLDSEEATDPHGAEAFMGLRYVVNDRPVTCEPSGYKSYNRIVATCYNYEGKDVAAEMIRLGFGLDCARYSAGKYRALEPAGIRAKLKQAGYC